MTYRIKKYRMDMEGRSVATAAVMLGLALFLRIAYYFGMISVDKVGAWQLLTYLIFPMILEIGMIVLLKGLRLNAPGLYGIIGAAYCLVMVFQATQYEPLVRVILAIIAFVLCGGLVFVCSAGWLTKEIGVAFFALIGIIRFFVFELKPYILSFRLLAYLPELAGLFALLAWMCMINGLKESRGK